MAYHHDSSEVFLPPKTNIPEGHYALHADKFDEHALTESGKVESQSDPEEYQEF